jgi:hypothetical protein
VRFCAIIFCGARLDNVANLHCEPSRLDTSQRSASPTLRRAGATGPARKQTERPSIVHTSLYLPEPVYEALREIAFEERLKIHDVVLEGIDLALRRRGYASMPRLRLTRDCRCAAEANATSVLVVREHLRFWEMRSRENFLR